MSTDVSRKASQISAMSDPIPAEKWLWLLYILTALLYISTLKHTVSWSEAGIDTWIAIYHGLNVFSDRPYGYDDIHYFTEFAFRKITYPHLTGLLQAGWYSLFDGAIWKMKIPAAFAFIAFLIIFGKILKHRLGGTETWYVIILVAASPYYFTFKEQLRTDLLYLALLYSSIFLFDLHSRDSASPKTSLYIGIAIGILGGLCTSIRAIGFAILPGIILHEFIRFRTPRLISLVAVGTMLIWIFGEKLIIQTGESGYTPQFKAALADTSVLWDRLSRNFFGYRYAVQGFFLSPSNIWLERLTVLIVVPTAAIGFFSSLLRNDSILESVLIVTGAVLMVNQTASEWPRYLLPFYPAILYWSYLGIRRIASLRMRNPAIPSGVLSLMIAVCFANNHIGRVQFQELQPGPTSESYLAAEKHLIQLRREGRLLASSIPFTTAVRVGGCVGAWPSGGNLLLNSPRSMREFLLESGPDVLFLKYTDKVPAGRFTGEPGIYYSDAQFIQDHGADLAELYRGIFENEDYRIYIRRTSTNHNRDRCRR